MLESKKINQIAAYFKNKPVLKAYLFGSYVRGEASMQSDIDILVELDYSKRVGLEFIQMQLDLEDLLESKVDLISNQGLSKYIKPMINQEKNLFMKSEVGDQARLNHILNAIEEIETYLLDINHQDFINNSMMKFACIKQLEVIGEAANHVSIVVKQAFPDIEWRQIIGMRNLFVHEYFGIDNDLVWNIVQFDIPV